MTLKRVEKGWWLDFGAGVKIATWLSIAFFIAGALLFLVYQVIMAVRWWGLVIVPVIVFVLGLGWLGRRLGLDE